MASLDSFHCKNTLNVEGVSYAYYDLRKAEENGLAGISALPRTMKILLENLLRHEDGKTVVTDDILALARWLTNRGSDFREIGFRPARVLMQDFTGVPAVVDLAAMRDGMLQLGGYPAKINPQIPVDLVIDHSIIVDHFGARTAFQKNVALEYHRNLERYRFLKWGQSAFKNFRVVPPGTGICHQVNLEFLGKTVWKGSPDASGQQLVYPDAVVGTDSHTTMINALSVLGWGVGGIEAEAAMLGQPLSMLLPEVIGIKLTGALPVGVTATDLVLTIAQTLRKKGVVGKFVEFYGPGVSRLTLADRATIANMSPEFGATCAFFPTDDETLRYLETTNRTPDEIALVASYAKAQGLFFSPDDEPVFTDVVTMNLETIVPSLSGPKRPEERVDLSAVKTSFGDALTKSYKKDPRAPSVPVAGTSYALGHGDVVIAAITSCTNTSNPDVLITAGLLARNAVARGLKTKPWVKTSLAPGSQVVASYLTNSGLQPALDALGFYLVGFGCTTCIGNSGPLAPEISRTINENGLIAAGVLSGNRNFEGRVSPDVQANYLASPPLVVAYAIAGSIRIDLSCEPLGEDAHGAPVYLHDVWPAPEEIATLVSQYVTRKVFAERYADVFEGDDAWREIDAPSGETYAWDETSTYVRNPPYFTDISPEPAPVQEVCSARVLALLGDKITTDHISPAGAISLHSPAGAYLEEHGVSPQDFNQYGARRGNHEVMLRGTFANIRLRNHMLGPSGKEGGYTIHHPSGEETSIYEASRRYAENQTPLVVFAGKEYGNGSSRDWAAKGACLLGVRAVIATSFERIHRSNLVGMGVLPLVSEDGSDWRTWKLNGAETITLTGLSSLKPKQKLSATITRENEETFTIPLVCRIDTAEEMSYFRNAGILSYVLRNLVET